MGKNATYLLFNVIGILITLLISGLTIAASFAGKISPQESWLMTWISLGLPLLLILNLLLFIYWLMKFKFWAILPLVAMILNFGFISSMFQINFSKAESGGDLRIATYNVRGFQQNGFRATLNNISELLKQESVDVVCLQEFINAPTDRLDTIYERFSFLPYKVISVDSNDLPLAIFSKYPITTSGMIQFPNSNNGAMWVDIDLMGVNVRVLNCHLQTTNVNQSGYEIAKLKNEGVSNSSGREAMNTIASRLYINFCRRANQVVKVNSVIDTTGKTVIVCGDFNDTPASYTYNQMTQYLTDGFKDCGRGYAYTYRPYWQILRLDYILYSENVIGVRYYSPRVDFSDHNPVMLEFNLRN